jgi:hypothetical protein
VCQPRQRSLFAERGSISEHRQGARHEVRLAFRTYERSRVVAVRKEALPAAKSAPAARSKSPRDGRADDQPIAIVDIVDIVKAICVPMGSGACQ